MDSGYHCPAVSEWSSNMSIISPHVLLHLLFQVPVLLWQVIAKRALDTTWGVERWRWGLVAVAWWQRGFNHRGLCSGGGKWGRWRRWWWRCNCCCIGDTWRGLVVVTAGGGAVVRIKPLQRVKSLNDLWFGHAWKSKTLEEVNLLYSVARFHITTLHSGICKTSCLWICETINLNPNILNPTQSSKNTAPVGWIWKLCARIIYKHRTNFFIFELVHTHWATFTL